MIAMAGSNTVEHERGDADQRNAIMYEQYIALVDSFEADDFENVHDNLQKIMKDRLKYAQGQVTGEKLWNKYTAIRKEPRLMHTRIKTNPRDIPSGKQLRDVNMDWLLTRFKELGVRLMFLFILHAVLCILNIQNESLYRLQGTMTTQMTTSREKCLLIGG